MNDSDIRFDLLMALVILPLVMVLLIPIGFISIGYMLLKIIYNETIGLLWQRIKEKRKTCQTHYLGAD